MGDPCDLDDNKECNEKTSYKPLINLHLVREQLPKYQHMPNDRQKRREYRETLIPRTDCVAEARRGEVSRTV